MGLIRTIYDSFKDYIEYLFSLEGNREVGDAEEMDEKWSPAIWMESLLASLVWVLESPNLDSPANVDAKKLYTRFSHSNLHLVKK